MVFLLLQLLSWTELSVFFHGFSLMWTSIAFTKKCKINKLKIKQLDFSSCHLGKVLKNYITMFFPHCFGFFDWQFKEIFLMPLFSLLHTMNTCKHVVFIHSLCVYSTIVNAFSLTDLAAKQEQEKNKGSLRQSFCSRRPWYNHLYCHCDRWKEGCTLKPH